MAKLNEEGESNIPADDIRTDEEPAADDDSPNKEPAPSSKLFLLVVWGNVEIRDDPTEAEVAAFVERAQSVRMDESRWNEVERHCLERPQDILYTAKWKAGITPLHMACMLPHIPPRVMRTLVDTYLCHAPLLGEDTSSVPTPLHLACGKRLEPYLHVLEPQEEREERVYDEVVARGTSFYWEWETEVECCVAADTETIRILLDAFDPVKSTSAWYNDATPLHTACIEGVATIEVLDLLLKANPDTMWCRNSFGFTALDNAISSYGFRERRAPKFFSVLHCILRHAATYDPSLETVSRLATSADYDGDTPILNLWTRLESWKGVELDHVILSTGPNLIERLYEIFRSGEVDQLDRILKQILGNHPMKRELSEVIPFWMALMLLVRASAATIYSSLSRDGQVLRHGHSAPGLELSPTPSLLPPREGGDGDKEEDPICGMEQDCDKALHLSDFASDPNFKLLHGVMRLFAKHHGVLGGACDDSTTAEDPAETSSWDYSLWGARSESSSVSSEAAAPDPFTEDSDASDESASEAEGKVPVEDLSLVMKTNSHEFNQWDFAGDTALSIYLSSPTSCWARTALSLPYLLRAAPRAARMTGRGRTPLVLALAFRPDLTYDNGLKALIDCAPEAMRSRDTATGMYPFMVAAMSDGGASEGGQDDPPDLPSTQAEDVESSSSDLTTIYLLVCACPYVFRHFVPLVDAKGKTNTRISSSKRKLASILSPRTTKAVFGQKSRSLHRHISSE